MLDGFPRGLWVRLIKTPVQRPALCNSDSVVLTGQQKRMCKIFADSLTEENRAKRCSLWLPAGVPLLMMKRTRCPDGSGKASATSADRWQGAMIGRRIRGM